MLLEVNRVKIVVTPVIFHPQVKEKEVEQGGINACKKSSFTTPIKYKSPGSAKLC